MIGTDSLDYEVLAEATRLIKGVEGMTIELGVRTGGGSKVIIDSLINNNDWYRTHLCVDPYGHIPYLHHEDREERLDYTNVMRNQCVADLNLYTKDLQVNLVFFILSDTDFFRCFGGGIPIYELERTACNKYALAHLDGPHSAEAVIHEMQFFETRSDKGAMIICDDVSDYDHDRADKYILRNGWELVTKTDRKISYRKK